MRHTKAVICLIAMLFIALSSEASDSFERGMAAAQQQSWKLAIEYFSKALEEEPFSGPVIFNMGLANARAGNDLAAIAWFKAYLELEPNAKNRNNIEQEMIRLEVAARTKTDKLFSQALETAMVLPGYPSPYGGTIPKYVVVEGEIRVIAFKQANAGDIKGALRNIEFTEKIAPESAGRKFDEPYWKKMLLGMRNDVIAGENRYIDSIYSAPASGGLNAAQVKASAWSGLAKDFSKNEIATDLNMWVTTIKSGNPEKAPAQISDAAYKLASGISKIRAMEKRLGGGKDASQ